jgi:hypothetical protein
MARNLIILWGNIINYHPKEIELEDC